jgi:hypothetical protein
MSAHGTPEKSGSGQLIQPERTIVKGRGSAEDDLKLPSLGERSPEALPLEQFRSNHACNRKPITVSGACLPYLT